MSSTSNDYEVTLFEESKLLLRKEKYFSIAFVEHDVIVITYVMLQSYPLNSQSSTIESKL